MSKLVSDRIMCASNYQLHQLVVEVPAQQASAATAENCRATDACFPLAVVTGLSKKDVHNLNCGHSNIENCPFVEAIRDSATSFNYALTVTYETRYVLIQQF